MIHTGVREIVEGIAGTHLLPITTWGGGTASPPIEILTITVHRALLTLVVDADIFPVAIAVYKAPRAFVVIADTIVTMRVAGALHTLVLGAIIVAMPILRAFDTATPRAIAVSTIAAISAAGPVGAALTSGALIVVILTLIAGTGLTAATMTIRCAFDAFVACASPVAT